MKDDEFGNRMKSYEPVDKLDVNSPIIIRLDGRGFSKFTKSYKKPFDYRIADAMIATTIGLVDQFGASIGYTQSDEITLVIPKVEKYSGRLQKLVSMTASVATGNFNREINDSKIAYFDSRVFNVPNISEATNAVLWRVHDARKNGISSICHSLVGTKRMFKCDQAAMLKIISNEGVEYTNFSTHAKFGVFVKRVKHIQENNTDIPEKYRPNEPVIRQKIAVVDVDFLGLSHQERIHFIDCV